MRRTITSLIFCAALAVFIPTNVDGQRFKAGLAGGFNLSQLDGDKLGGFNQIGVNAGGRVAAILADRWQLSIEMLFSQQGSSRVKTDDPNSIYDRIRLNFVEVPVMINFLEWKFHVSAGFSYARLINFKAIDFTGEDITDGQSYNPDIFSFIVGATYYFNDNVGLNVRWSKYFNDLQAEKGDNKLIGRNIGVRAIYMF